MFSRRIVFYAPNKATAIVCVTGKKSGYFDYLTVFPESRRKGFCTSLLAFIFTCLEFRPDIDIRNQSLVMKRIAVRFGYVKKGVSDRFRYCNRWINKNSGIAPILSHQLVMLRKRNFYSRNKTELIYIKFIEQNKELK